MGLCDELELWVQVFFSEKRLLKLDLFNLIIPRVVGGASQEAIELESSTFKQWSQDYPELKTLVAQNQQAAQNDPTINPLTLI